VAELDVAEQLRQYLIDEDLAVAAADADGIHPIVVCDPRDGAPLPVLTDAGLDFTAGTLTLTTPTEPSAGEDNARTRTVVSIMVRARTHPQARLIVRQIQNLLTPPELWGGKHQFQMGQINPVHLCLPFRGPQRIAAEEDAYTFELAFEFLVSRSVLSV